MKVKTKYLKRLWDKGWEFHKDPITMGWIATDGEKTYRFEPYLGASKFIGLKVANPFSLLYRLVRYKKWDYNFIGIKPEPYTWWKRYFSPSKR